MLVDTGVQGEPPNYWAVWTVPLRQQGSLPRVPKPLEHTQMKLVLSLINRAAERTCRK